MSDDLKRRAAAAALDFVEPGMKLGLGTGSTATFFVTLLGERIRQGLDVRCTATSTVTEDHARQSGVPVEDLDTLLTLDLTVDGADEIDGAFRLIKGGGGALLREKIVASASDRMLVIADAAKKVGQLGRFPLPIELVSFGHLSTLERVRTHLSGLGYDGSVALRTGADGDVFRTDNGNVIADAALQRIDDPERLEASLALLPGVVECGLFLGMATHALIASEGGVERLERPTD